MPALDDMVKLLRERVEAKSKKEENPVISPRNPNAERFAHLHNADEVREGTSRSLEKPRELLEQEASHGKGISAGRILRAIACAQKFFRNESPTTGAIKVIHNLYRDKALAKWLEGAVSKDLTANIPNEGGYLIPEQVYDEIVELLYPKVVVFKLGASEIPMVTGALSLNYIESGTTAQYVGEGETPTPTDVKFGQATFRSKKLISLIPISNDLLKVPSPKADQIVLSDALKQMAVRMNKAAFQDDGSQNTPRGLKYETGLTTATISGLMDSLSMIKVFVALEEANIDIDAMDRPGSAFNHKLWGYLQTLADLNGQYYYRNTGNTYADGSGQAKGLAKTFEGYPFATTQLIPSTGSSNPYTTDFYFGDWSEFWVPRQGMLEVDSSDVAAYNTSSNTVVSAYSKDQTVIRLIDRHDMGMRQRKAMCRASVTFNQ